jgi:large repetitive protein
MAWKFINNRPYNIEGGASWSSYWKTRFPSLLVLTVVSDTEIDLSWTNNGLADYTGVSIEQSTDGVNYSEVATVAAGATTKAITGLTEGTSYYFRIRYYKS